MSGEKRSREQARRAANAADSALLNFQQQQIALRDRANQETIKAQRLLMRALRAGGGGFFESDADKLGGSGAIA